MQNFDFLDFSHPRDSSGNNSIVDWHAIFHLLWDKIWLIILCLLLAAVAASTYLKSAPRVYEALTSVQVEQEDAKIVKAEQVVTEDMRGLDVLDTVAEKLVNPALLEQVLAANQLLPPEDMSVTNGSKSLTRETAIAQFAHNVKASLRHNTRLIDITVRNTDRRLAAQLANSLVENYLAQDALAQHAIIEGANTFLQQEAGRQERKLEASEQALQDYRRKSALVSLEQSQDIITPRLQDLSKRLTQSKANLVQAQGAYQNSLKMSTIIEDLLAYTNVSTDPGVVQISTEVAKHENNFVSVRERYREKNPKYIEAAASLDGLKQLLATNVLKVRARIQEGLRITYQDALTSEKGLEAELRDTESNAMQLSDAGVRFNVLSREVESDKAQFDSIINRLGETAIAAQITPERIRVIQPAVVPEHPTSPKTKLIVVFALFCGLLGGLGIAFVSESVNTSFRTADDAEHYLGLPVLGTIPKLPETELNGGKLAEGGDAWAGERPKDISFHKRPAG
jgi:polysaccharide biosynthesis transport protein